MNSTIEAPASATQDAKSLLTADQFAGVRATVMDANSGMAASLAGRIVEQAVAFVATSARFPEARIAPSPVVDEGWHALVLDTQLYATLCEAVGGFVHHYPQGPEPSGYDPELTAYTLTVMTNAGYGPDMDLWQGPGANEIAVGATTWHTPSDSRPIVITKRPKPKPKDDSGA
ncbi:glycine-rich domain-containing protein [Streptomyces sp. NPDC087420]|uniref:glycine-rich domain-containing protein n=1 Tax=Streptomyces sp. NPDC087420 TaxID=3365785 RepID=UPI003832DAAE